MLLLMCYAKMLLLLRCPLALLAWSPWLLDMSVSAPMQRRCCCSVCPWRCWLGHQGNLKCPQRCCCCSVVPLALHAWSPQLLEMPSSATMQRCCCFSVFLLALPAWSPSQVMSPGSKMGFPLVTISSFGRGISMPIVENHAATYYLQWALLLTVVLPLFVWFPSINFAVPPFLMLMAPLMIFE